MPSRNQSVMEYSLLLNFKQQHITSLLIPVGYWYIVNMMIGSLLLLVRTLGKVLSGQNNNVPVSNLEVNGFVLVKVYSLNSKWKNVLAQIIDGPDEDGDSEAIFLKRSIKIKDGFFIQTLLRLFIYPRPRFD